MSRLILHVQTEQAAQLLQRDHIGKKLQEIEQALCHILVTMLPHAQLTIGLCIEFTSKLCCCMLLAWVCMSI